VAAIEQAVKDGVNVINFSIGPNAGGGQFNEPTEVAFLGAAAAGVFVAASAGNSGPATAPVAHISPWLTTVGNSTHNRTYAGDVALGNGVTVTGASGNANTPSSPLILAKDAGLAGVDPADPSLNLCFGPADGPTTYLDPAKVTGKILVCDRGSNVLVNKSANGKTAGAVGVIIANTPTSAQTTLNQAHSISTVHISSTDGATLKAYYASTPGATAALNNLRGIVDPKIVAPQMNSSSSRGPNVANANIMKPDVTAPGTDILAAVSADLTKAERNAVAAGAPAPSKDFAFYTGTSMASPHVAGIAALLKQRHPDWSPAMIKSALMTTAYDTFNDGQNGSVSWDSSARTTGTLPWGQGAGHVAPSVAVDPGLVYDLSTIDYARFLCGLGITNVFSPGTCSAVGSIQPYNLNLASLTAANVLGIQTLTRTVKNVGSSAATYNVTTTLPGYTVDVQPATLNLAPGASATYTVKLTRTSAPLNTWVYGKLTWSDGTHTVRSPLTARASTIAVPGTVQSEATSGTKVITIGTGFAGAMTTAKSGLIPATEFNSTVVKATNTANSVCTGGGGTGVNVHTVSIPAGTTTARFALYDSDTSGNGKTDLDLVVARGTTVVGTSGGDTANEMVTLANPPAGDYKVCVVGYAPVGGSATYKLSTWVLTPTATGGNFKALAPSQVALGGTASVAISWSGLATGKRYLGSVSFATGGTTAGTTLVEVDTTDPIPLFQNAGNKQATVE
jgi:subtilisin family serine protease